MVKETARKCSHCGHKSRNCKVKGGVRLFGVNISDQNQVKSKKESVGIGSLQSLAEPNAGNLSDDQVHSERKKGKQWTQEEHQLFLTALKAVGKGNWKEISKCFVPTITRTQIASHAQKFFLRQALSDKKNRRSSLFDIPLKDSVKLIPLRITYEIAAQIITKSPHPRLDPVITVAATCSIPNYCGIPYMLQAPAGTSNVPPLSWFRAMNYQISAYVFRPLCLRSEVSGNFTNCTPGPVHPSRIASPESLLQSTFPAHSRPSNEQDPLQLKIWASQSSQKE